MALTRRTQTRQGEMVFSGCAWPGRARVRVGTHRRGSSRRGTCCRGRPWRVLKGSCAWRQRRGHKIYDECRDAEGPACRFDAERHRRGRRGGCAARRGCPLSELELPLSVGGHWEATGRPLVLLPWEQRTRETQGTWGTKGIGSGMSSPKSPLNRGRRPPGRSLGMTTAAESLVSRTLAASFFSARNAIKVIVGHHFTFSSSSPPLVLIGLVVCSLSGTSSLTAFTRWRLPSHSSFTKPNESLSTSNYPFILHLRRHATNMGRLGAYNSKTTLISLREEC